MIYEHGGAPFCACDQLGWLFGGGRSFDAAFTYKFVPYQCSIILVYSVVRTEVRPEY
jgi:hypothetical protein